MAIADLQTPCKICGTGSPLFDVVDFHEDCYDVGGRRMPLSGVPVYYYRCPGCGFLFTRQFDGCSRADFTHDGEISADPAVNRDVIERRARDHFSLLKGWFVEGLDALRLLELGNGRLAALLRDSGCPADSTDAISHGVALTKSTGPYDIVLAFDILEHLADPLAKMKQIEALMAPDGLLLLSARLGDGSDTVPTGIRRRPLRYVSPRMGQISIYNACSLALVLGTIGFRIAGLKQGVHVGARSIPDFASHLFADHPLWGS